MVLKSLQISTGEFFDVFPHKELSKVSRSSLSLFLTIHDHMMYAS